ncbi:ROK family protein [Arthrobacter tecti]
MAEFALGVDFGGTKVEAALVDIEGSILPESRHRLPTGSGSSSEELVVAVQHVAMEALSAIPADAALLGIGIGSAGPIGLLEGVVSPVNIGVWREFPLRSVVEKAAAKAGYSSEPILRLDGLCITLAEMWVGAGQGCSSLMGMVVSTGVGGGIIADGRVVSGKTGNAGHIGQIEVPGFTLPGVGCTLEEIASGPNTVRWARTHGWKGSTGEDLALSYAMGNETAVSAVRRSASAVGRALASVTTLLDLERVVIGGGFSQVTPDYCELVQEAAQEHAQLDYSTGLKILPTGLGTDGPLIGAAALVHRGAGREIESVHHRAIHPFETAT